LLCRLTQSLSYYQVLEFLDCLRGRQQGQHFLPSTVIEPKLKLSAFAKYHLPLSSDIMPSEFPIIASIALLQIT
jgi:hypothetical protein